MSDIPPFFICPFCAYKGRLIRFRYKTIRGISKRTFKCPDCGNLMRRNTLTKKVTPKLWAEWLYSCIRLYKIHGYDNALKQDFFHKIKWEKLFERLKKLGISKEFWDSWKNIKQLSKLGLINESYFNKVIDEFDEPEFRYTRKGIDAYV